MDQERFFRICQEIDLAQPKQDGIGTLQEKMIHAVLKRYYEEDIEKQEVPIGRYIADIFTGTEVIEVQTQQLHRLREKLSAFLEKYPVTVVYPVVGKKWVYWVDPETGEISKGRVSPKHGNVFDAFYELYQIKSFLTTETLTVRIPVVTVREYKCLNGWSQDRKRGGTRMERIPVQMEEEMVFRTVADYMELVSDRLEQLKDGFTCKEFAQDKKISVKQAQYVLHVLCYIGALQQNGKKGRAYCYKKKRVTE